MNIHCLLILASSLMMATSKEITLEGPLGCAPTEVETFDKDSEKLIITLKANSGCPGAVKKVKITGDKGYFNIKASDYYSEDDFIDNKKWKNQVSFGLDIQAEYTLILNDKKPISTVYLKSKEKRLFR